MARLLRLPLGRFVVAAAAAAAAAAKQLGFDPIS